MVFEFELAFVCLHARGTNAMRENDAGMFCNIGLHLLPVTFVVADTFAGGADGQQSGESLDLFRGGAELFSQLLAFILGLFLLADVAGNGRGADNFPRRIFDR